MASRPEMQSWSEHAFSLVKPEPAFSACGRFPLVPDNAETVSFLVQDNTDPVSQLV